MISQSRMNLYYSIVAGKVYENGMDADERGSHLRYGLFRNLSIQPGERVIEIGVGTGRNFPYYSPWAFYVATDINPRMLKVAKKRMRKDRGIYLTRQDATSLGFPDNSFDTAICTYALSVIPDRERALREMRRVVRPNGRIGIIDFSRTSPLFFFSTVAGLNLDDLVTEFGEIEYCDTFHKHVLHKSYVLRSTKANWSRL